jgi:hypothetical protein
MLKIDMQFQDNDVDLNNALQFTEDLTRDIIFKGE